ELARLVTAVEVVPGALAGCSSRADHVLVLAHVALLSNRTLGLLGVAWNASWRLYSRLALPVTAVDVELVVGHQRRQHGGEAGRNRNGVEFHVEAHGRYGAEEQCPEQPHCKRGGVLHGCTSALPD